MAHLFLPLSVDLPAHVILEVTSTEPGVKGNTATNATKPASVETGAKINVPLFINEGDKIRIERFVIIFWMINKNNIALLYYMDFVHT